MFFSNSKTDSPLGSESCCQWRADSSSFIWEKPELSREAPGERGACALLMFFSSRWFALVSSQQSLLHIQKIQELRFPDSLGKVLLSNYVLKFVHSLHSKILSKDPDVDLVRLNRGSFCAACFWCGHDFRLARPNKPQTPSTFEPQVCRCHLMYA